MEEIEFQFLEENGSVQRVIFCAGTGKFVEHPKNVTRAQRNNARFTEIYFRYPYVLLTFHVQIERGISYLICRHRGEKKKKRVLSDESMICVGAIFVNK